MREEFSTPRGYDCPVPAELAERVESAEETQQLSGDFQRTIEDLFRDLYFGLSATLAHAAGVNS